MRSFQIISLLIFVAVFLLTVLGSWLNLKKLMAASSCRKSCLLFFVLLNVVVITGFVLLYIYPFHPRTASDYPLYFYFNSLLLALFIFHLPMSLGWLGYFFFERNSKSPVFPRIGVVPALGLAVCMLYGTFFGSREMRLKEITLAFSNLPERFNDYRIAQISDFHLGGALNPERLLVKAKKKLEKAEPDLILFTGDLVNNFASEAQGAEKLVGSICSVAGCYSILGNHDYGDYTRWDSREKKAANFDAIVRTHGAMGFKLLKNEHVVLTQGTDSIFLAGVENWGHPPFPQYADLDAALKGIPHGTFTILMTHDPAHWEERIAGRENIDLTLSGHTHGMQWGMKLAGIPFSLASFVRNTWGGLYNYGDQLLYVNTGLGTIGLPWRLDMPAEITIITLKSGEVD
jgi:uncharacterized protein